MTRFLDFLSINKHHRQLREVIPAGEMNLRLRCSEVQKQVRMQNKLSMKPDVVHLCMEHGRSDIN